MLSLGVMLAGLALAAPAAAEVPTAPSALPEAAPASTNVDLSIDGAGAAALPGMTVVPRRTLDVTIVTGNHRRHVRTAAASVSDLLREQGIGLAAHDRIAPSVTAPLSEGTIVRIARAPRAHAWTAHVRETVSVPTIRRYVSTLPHGTSKLIASGDRGERELTVRFVETPGARTQRAVLSARIIRAPKPRIIAIGRLESFARVAERGITSTMRLASSALSMLATAYIGDGGFAANGSRAGFGIVAVDPAIIPLGTRLFIPGYGKAIAGDTGGAIHGHRIDLGMNRLVDAVNFGSRTIKVYVLR